MNLEKALNYITHHSEAIIQWLFLAILLMAGLLIGRSLFGRKTAGSKSADSVTLADGSDIQTFLQKIMDQTAKLETISAGSLTPATAGDVDQQVQALKKELSTREAEISAMKAGGDGKPSADAGALSSRIKELESKLAEYEILEDDIADLSLYKEENARLKSELDKAKSSAPAEAAPVAAAAPEVAAAPVPTAAPAPAPAPAPAATPAPAPAAVEATGEDIVAEFAQAVNLEPAAIATPDETMSSPNDALAEFASSELERKMAVPEAPVIPLPPEPEPVVAAPEPPPPMPPPPSTPAPQPVVKAAPVPPSPTAPTAEGDDLFAEFANPPAEPPDVATEGSLDTDKMMAEMAALVNVDGTSAAGGGLEEMSDIEKMAAEATNLTKS